MAATNSLFLLGQNYMQQEMVKVSYGESCDVSLVYFKPLLTRARSWCYPLPHPVTVDFIEGLLVFFKTRKLI